jgi:hypothetical protein
MAPTQSLRRPPALALQSRERIPHALQLRHAGVFDVPVRELAQPLVAHARIVRYGPQRCRAALDLELVSDLVSK